MARDSAGNAVSEPTVTVFLAGTATPATIFSTVGGAAETNPFTGDTDGEWEFFVDAATAVKVKVEKAGFDTWEKDYIAGGITSHGDLTDLATGDPHTQYDRTAVFDTRRYASVQAAIDAAEAAGGGTVLVAEDVSLSALLTVDSDNVSFVSYNRATITAVASMTRFLTIAGCANVRVAGIHFDGNGNVTGEAMDLASTSSDVTVEDCEIEDTGAAGVVVKGTRQRVRRNEIHGSANLVRLSGASGSDIRVEGNNLYDFNRAVWVLGTAAVTFDDVWIEDNRIHDHDPTQPTRRPIVVEGDDSLPLTNIHVNRNRVVGNGNAFTDGTTPGTADQIAVNNTVGVEVVGNVSLDAGDNGIVISRQCQHIVFANNRAERCHNSGLQIGSTAASYTRDGVVTGNVSMNNGKSAGTAVFKSGLRMVNADHWIVDGNFFGDDQAGSETQQYGINVKDSDGVRIGLNQYSGNVLGAFNDEGGNTGLEIATLRTNLYPAYASPSAGATLWSSPARASQASQGQVSVPAPFAGFARNLRAVMVAAPGSGESLIVTLRNSATATSLTTTIAGTATSGADETNRPTFAKGDLLSFSFQASNNGSYAGTHCRVACELVELAD